MGSSIGGGTSSGGGGRASLVSSLVLCLVWSAAQSAQAFNCTSSSTCDAIIDYVSPNSTTLNAIQNLFNVKNLRSILGANNLPLSTPPNQTVSALQTLKIPFPCLCTNGTGAPHNPPLYKVVPGDGLYHIATDVFSGLVAVSEIQRANNISNPDRIFVGQELKIPLPCSCDEVDGERVVHYGHVVANGSSVAGIAQQYNTTQDILLKLNGLAGPNALLAGAILDVPLRACASMVSTISLDYPLLVPNGTYVFTARNCVKCQCDAAANNWTLQCEPSQIKPSSWASCPSMQCQGTENLVLGKTTTSGCNSTTCAYAGYTNQTINTTTVAALESTCPGPPAASGSGEKSGSSGKSKQVGSGKLKLPFFIFVQLFTLVLSTSLF